MRIGLGLSLHLALLAAMPLVGHTEELRHSGLDLDLDLSGLEEDLTELSLEELMDIELSVIEALGVHHTHRAGEVMLGYSFMFMEMIGNRDGTDKLRTSEVLQDFMVSPTRMTMEMHMFHLMYAPSNDLTLMGMLPYLRLSMNHITRTGTRFTTDSEGIGDLQLSALYTVFRSPPHRIHLDAGISLPTGSIDEEDDTPAGADQQLPYPMQLGSGTVDLRPGLTYLGQDGRLAWGAHLGGVVHLGRNSNEYRLGDRIEVTAWGGYKCNEWLSAYVRIDSTIWENIHGADPDLNPAQVPTADDKRRAGERVNLLLGLNLFQTSGFLDGHRLTLEGGLPLYQSLDGPQLEDDWQVSVAWQWTFSP